MKDDKVWIYFDCEDCDGSFEVQVPKSLVGKTKARCMCTDIDDV